MNQRKGTRHLMQNSSQRTSRTSTFLSLLMLLIFTLNPLAALSTSASSNPPSSARTTIQDIENLPRPLDLESRLVCRRAVEEVYWRHRIWPAENPAPKPDLEQVLPLQALQAKVEDELRRANALAELRQQSLTGAELQAEIERMAHATRQPAVLGEIFAALGSDPYLVAECLARPVLVDRLIHSIYAAQAGSEQSFDAWWQAEKGSFSTQIDAPDFTYQLVTPTQVELQDDTWTPTPALPEGVGGSTAVWTGLEMIIWGGFVNTGSRYNPVTDTWTTTATIGAPSPRRLHTAVWSGTEMIVWGGCDQDANFCDVSSGGRYDPLTDSWTPTNFPDAPVSRMNHTAVWTGSQMIVWAGCSIGSSGNNYCNIQRNDGGVYDPATDTWQAMSTAGAPSEREYHSAVWAGDVMIVWGGYNIGAVNTGGRYDPVSNTWQPTSTAGAPQARANLSMVWTGSEAIVWGGCDISLCIPGYNYFNTGGRYNPDTDTWTATSTVDAPQARAEHTAIWTGTEMIVWGGRTSALPYLNTGGRYDPVTDAWTATTTAGAPAAKTDHHAVWTGNEMIVWGGYAEPGTAKTGGRYDPASESWVPTNTNDPVYAKERHTAVWTGTEMLIWGGSNLIGDFLGLGIRFDTVTGLWSLMSTNSEPWGRFFHSAIWTGSEMIVWGGQYGTSLFNDGGRYNPMTDSWSNVSTAGAPSERAHLVMIWTGSEMIVWGGATYEGYTNTGGRYDPDTNTWTPTGTSGAPIPRGYLRGVWSGSEMIVWGGIADAGDTNTGGRYNPASNSWSPTSTAGAPTGRHFHTVIWTGSELIVWGGMSGNLDNGVWYNTGGVYDPFANTWTATSMTNVPTPRIWHVDVWTGEEMIVWGGCTGTTSCPNEVYTGGRYDLATDSWMSTSIQSAPSERANSSAVWTGSEMIVWAGLAGNVGTYTTTGGFYHATGIPNTPPQANPDEYTTDEDAALVVAAPGVLENDLDEEGNPLTALLVSNPINGTLDFSADGSFTYTPDAEFSGSDSFSYRANDGLAWSNITDVTITVQAVNDAPVAVDDSAATPEDTAISIPVLENDSDVDGPALSIAAVGIPDMGTAVISGTVVLYTPSADANGTDSFTYTVSDGSLQDTALVAVEITPVNDAPEATADAYSTAQDTALLIPAPGVLANDSDIDGDDLNAVLGDPPLHGNLVMEVDGGFSYTPDPGYSGSDQFTYQANDGSALSEVAVVSLTIVAPPPPGEEQSFFLPLVTR